MSEDFAKQVILKILKTKKKNKVFIKDDLQFQIAVTVIMMSENKQKIINEIKSSLKGAKK